MKLIKLEDLFNRWNFGKFDNPRTSSLGKEMRPVFRSAEYYQKVFGETRSIRCWDFNKNRFVYAKIKDVIFSGEKKVYEITTVDGKKIKASSNHPFLKKNEIWTNVEDLSSGDFIATNGCRYARKRSISRL